MMTTFHLCPLEEQENKRELQVTLLLERERYWQARIADAQALGAGERAMKLLLQLYYQDIFSCVYVQ